MSWYSRIIINCPSFILLVLIMSSKSFDVCTEASLQGIVSILSLYICKREKTCKIQSSCLWRFGRLFWKSVYIFVFRMVPIVKSICHLFSGNINPLEFFIFFLWPPYLKNFFSVIYEWKSSNATYFLAANFCVHSLILDTGKSVLIPLSLPI